MSWTKWVPVVGQIVDGVLWARNRIQLRRKRKLTEEERAEATRVAQERIEQIVKQTKTTTRQGKGK